METSDIEQPDKLRFVGKVKEPRKIVAAKEYLDTNVPPMPPEIERSKERNRQVQALTDATQDFAQQELQIDLSRRLPRLDRFHFLDKTGYQKVREMYNLNPGSVAVHSTSGHILVKEELSATETLGNANHELVHIASYRSINLCEIPEGGIRTNRGHSGYTNERNRALSLLDEALTEMTNIQIMAQYWGGENALSDLRVQDYGNIGYVEQVLIVDSLINRAAQAEGRGYKDVLKELQKGKFLGKAQALRVLTRTVGKKGMKNLARMTLSPHESLSFASEMRLSDAEEKIKRLRNREKVDLLENIAPGISAQLPKQPKYLG